MCGYDGSSGLDIELRIHINLDQIGAGVARSVFERAIH